MNKKTRVFECFVIALLLQMSGMAVFAQSPRSHLVTLDVESGDIRRFALGPSRPEEPEFSPNGRFILFDAVHQGNRDLYLMNIDGSNLRRLTTGPAKEDHGSWSPQGERIAYQHEHAGNTDVYVINADGTHPTRLTHHAARDGWPDWSPDGTQIVFSSDRDGHREIYLMQADGSALKRLTHSNGDSTDPSFSPNGEWIAFNSDREGNSEIYLMRTDGSHVRRLTRNDNIDERPAWSPDGQTILFSRLNLRTQQFSLHTIEVAGTREKRISPEGKRLTRAHWSTDGRGLVCQEMIPQGPAPEPDVVWQNFDPERFDEFAGKYELDEVPGMYFIFEREGDRFYGQPSGQARVEILPSSEFTFFPRNYPGKIIFHREENGLVLRVTVEQGRRMKASRVDR